MTRESRLKLSELTIRVVGNGRVGRAVVAALRSAGLELADPRPRGERGVGADIVLLAVPDDAIKRAGSLIVEGPIVAHMSGATTLEPLEPHERFSLHPLTTISGLDSRATAAHPFEGAFAAVASSSDRAQQLGEQLAAKLGMRSFKIRDEDRAAYHAAASIASNYLITLEWVAERLATTAGVDRDALLPLVQASVANWGRHGAERALTGPVVRGDVEIVARQRAAVAERLPDQLALFDALTAATEQLAHRR